MFYGVFLFNYATTWLINFLQPRLKLRWSLGDRRSHLRRESDPKMLPTEQISGKMWWRNDMENKEGKKGKQDRCKGECLWAAVSSALMSDCTMDCKKKRGKN